LLRFHGIGADPEQIRHRYGDGFGVAEMMRCAKEFGLKARTYRSNWRRLIKTPLPGIAVLRDGNCLLLGKARRTKFVVQDSLFPRFTIMSRE
jgi:subfamily B ATP-binding cassette protein HlyB/CyaB